MKKELRKVIESLKILQSNKRFKAHDFFTQQIYFCGLENVLIVECFNCFNISFIFFKLQAWGVIKAMSSLDEFLNLDRDIEGSAKRWKKLVDSEAPEKEKLPQEWKNKPPVQQMCILRTLRPDRMTYALGYVVQYVKLMYCCL